MSKSSPFIIRSATAKELQPPARIQKHIEELIVDYREEHERLLNQATKRPGGDAVAEVARYLRNGDELVRRALGWELRDAEIVVDPKVVDELHRLRLISYDA